MAGTGKKRIFADLNSKGSVQIFVLVWRCWKASNWCALMTSLRCKKLPFFLRLLKVHHRHLVFQSRQKGALSGGWLRDYANCSLYCVFRILYSYDKRMYQFNKRWTLKMLLGSACIFFHPVQNPYNLFSSFNIQLVHRGPLLSKLWKILTTPKKNGGTPLKALHDMYDSTDEQDNSYDILMLIFSWNYGSQAP